MKDMPKRKRAEVTSVTALDFARDPTVHVQCSRFKTRFDQGHKSLISALKLARGFERQKLGRRQKQAAKDGHALLKLREEITVLKSLDLSDIAEKYLFKQLVRTKRIRQSSVFSNLYGDSPEIQASKPGAEANVTARLFNSNPVRDVMPRIMKSIKHILGIEEGQEIAKPPGLSLGSSKRRRDGPEKEESSKTSFGSFLETTSHRGPLNAGHDHQTAMGLDEQVDRNGFKHRACI